MNGARPCCRQGIRQEPPRGKALRQGTCCMVCAPPLAKHSTLDRTSAGDCVSSPPSRTQKNKHLRRLSRAAAAKKPSAASRVAQKTRFEVCFGSSLTGFASVRNMWSQRTGTWSAWCERLLTEGSSARFGRPDSTKLSRCWPGVLLDHGRVGSGCGRSSRRRSAGDRRRPSSGRCGVYSEHGGGQ